MITKTIPVISGELSYQNQITINIKGGTFTRGFFLSNQSYSGTTNLTDIFAALTSIEIDAVKKFIKIGTRMTANIGVEPDTLLIDTDIADELQ